MRIEILGASGGIGESLRTSCLLLDEDTLIDCGTGAGDLSLARLNSIKQVFLTHSHLDHTALLPMLADSAGRERPVWVYALAETIAALKAHVFNGIIWPDYTVLPTPEKPYVSFREIRLGEAVILGKRKITALPVAHSVAAAGFLLESEKGCFAVSGDTTWCDAFWEELRRVENLQYLMIEATLLDENRAGAEKAGHMTPGLLQKGFQMLAGKTEILITHMEPGREEETMRQILAHSRKLAPRQIVRGDVFSC